MKVCLQVIVRDSVDQASPWEGIIGIQPNMNPNETDALDIWLRVVQVGCDRKVEWVGRFSHEDESKGRSQDKQRPGTADGSGDGDDDA